MDLHGSKWACTVNAMTYGKQVAERVNQAIERSPYSFKHVAEQALIPRGTLYRKKDGGGDFTITELYGIAKVLGLKMSDLVPDETIENQAA